MYVMLGEVLAAQCDLDDERMLRILRAAGHVDEARHQVLWDSVASGAGLSESLFDLLPEDLLMELLFERFRENLFQFCSTDGAVEFLPMDAVFVENIQVGHDTRSLLEELVALRARIGTLARQPQLVLAAGATPTATGMERTLLARCAPRRRLADLLATSPWESTRLLELVRLMLDEGKLVGKNPPLDEEHPGELTSDDDTADAPLSGGPGAGPAWVAALRGPAGVAVEPVDVAVEPTDVAAEPVDVAVEPADDEAEPAAAAAEPAEWWPRPAASFDEGDDDDMAAFRDYDTVREAGAFLTDRTLLDRVELDKVPEQLVASTETLIEMEDAEGKDVLKSAVSLNFSGPKLHDEEIQRKLDVTNDVLATICAAIEAADGRGSGVARMQLLVEGTSVPLAPLFKGVDVAADGRLPIAVVIKNLRKRPAGEHRRLLNRGLSDLIERALSAADEVLDVDGFEAMLTLLAGYQQRLGV
ncbi:MAG: hypothetical protein Q8P18_26175 [Pseudomonadota bacterium]|nr:hypothetical protein [Pseudomonadota bacterium]